MTTDTKTLTTVNDATALLRELAETHDWVSVFWDRGWGDSGQTAEISIIVDGNGQQPLAHLTPEVYAALRDQQVIGENTLMTFKARRVHDYKTPPKKERTRPNPAKVAEQAIRRFMTDHPDWPIMSEFFRGLSRDWRGLPQIDRECAKTPAAASGWFVLILPGGDSMAVSAWKRDRFGDDIIGGGVADTFNYPTTASGEVNVEALAGEDFQRQLAEVVAEKVAAIEAERAK